MSTPSTQPKPIEVLLGDQYVARASEAVELGGVDSKLLDFLSWLGHVHNALFGSPLVVTSGRDSIHGTGSKHYRGEAFDMRTKDKTPEQCGILLIIIATFSVKFGVAVFDERALAGQEHFHIELAG